MMPPPPQVMFLPRPRLKKPTSPRVPTLLPFDRDAHCLGRVLHNEASLCLGGLLMRSISEGMPKRLLGTMQSVLSVTMPPSRL